MKARTVIGIIVMMLVLVQAGTAGGKDDFQKYFNDTANKVKATDNPTQKRTFSSIATKHVQSFG